MAIDYTVAEDEPHDTGKHAERLLGSPSGQTLSVLVGADDRRRGSRLGAMLVTGLVLLALIAGYGVLAFFGLLPTLVDY